MRRNSETIGYYLNSRNYSYLMVGDDIRKNYLLIVLAGILVVSCMKKIELPGPVENGMRLPNNWILTPAGMKHIPVGDLPLNMALSPEGKLLAFTNNGLSRQFISLIDTDADSVVQEVNLEKSFYGLSFGPAGKHLYASGGSDEKICVWSITGSDIVPEEGFSLKSENHPGKIFSTGLAVSRDARTVYAAECTSHRICLLSAETGRIIRKIPVVDYPYSQEDATPEILLNQIIWKSIRGHDSEMPAPVHRRSPATDFDD